MSEAQTEPLVDLSLKGDVVALRPMHPVDLPMIKEAAHDPMIPSITSVPTAEDYDDAAGLAFIERQQSRRISGAGWSLAIVDIETDRAIGQIGLWISHLRKGRVESGYWVAPSGRKQGAAGVALQLLSNWAFEHLDVDRISLFIEPWNIASQKTAEHAGFEQEVLLQSWERVAGIHRDMWSYVRLART